MADPEEITVSSNHTLSAAEVVPTNGISTTEVELTEITTQTGCVTTDQPNSEMSSVMESPQVLAALQEKMHRELENDTHPTYYLPPVVKRRVKALKRLQSESKYLLADFYKEVVQVEIKYASLFDSLHAKRYDVISGHHEPTDDEASWVSEEDEELAAVEQSLTNVSNSAGDRAGTGAGIPSFWLTVFKNTDMLADMVNECDEKILKHMDDIRVEHTDGDLSPGFKLHFVFSENEYFTNPTLTKTYVMNYEPSDADPLAYVGPEIVDHTGCNIDWKPGKDVTVKSVKKTQKNKQSGDTRLVHLKVPNESFFTFFNTKERSTDDYYDEEAEAAIQHDFEVAHFLKESIIPNAVLYFTGEVYDYGEDVDELEGGDDDIEGDYDDEYDDDDEDNADDADSRPPRTDRDGYGDKPTAAGGGAAAANAGQNTSVGDCKQQ